MKSPAPILVAVRCKLSRSDIFYPQLGVTQQAKVVGESPNHDARFSFETGPLHPTNLLELQKWEAHGFTVIELPPSLVGNSYYGEWQNQVAQLALRRLATIHEKQKWGRQMAGYDKELAREVLVHLNEIFPGTLSNMQLKYQLSVEPSDEVLLAVLEALRKQGFIEGDEKRENTSGAHRLIALRAIGITPAGQSYLEGQSPSSPIANYYINHGQAGAMGPNSSGTINYQQQYSQIENDTDLSAIADRFEEAIKQRMALSPSSSDFAELHLMAQAKEQARRHEGGKLMETVSLIGKTAVPILTNAGAHALVSWLERKLGTKLS